MVSISLSEHVAAFAKVYSRKTRHNFTSIPRWNLVVNQPASMLASVKWHVNSTVSWTKTACDLQSDRESGTTS
jgi:hypothetical protein